MATIEENDNAQTLSRAKDFFLRLIFTDSSQTTINPMSNVLSILFQNVAQQKLFQHAHYQLEETRHRLVKATINVHLTYPDDTLSSFLHPTTFYQVAIRGFHNTLFDKPPDTLGEAVALCAMSHAASCSLRVNNSYPYLGFDRCPDIGLWRNTISNREHRFVFDELIKASCLEPYSTDFSVMSANAGDLLWDSSSSADQYQHSSPVTGESAQHITVNQASQRLRLQKSSIITNFTDFLRDCGEFPRVFSRRGTTAKEWQAIGPLKPAKSGDEDGIKHLYMELLRQDESLKIPIIQGILSAVYGLDGLGYLQSVSELKDNFLLVAKVLLPSTEVFLNFDQSIRDTMTEAMNRNSSTNGVKCVRCGAFVKYRKNMKRHTKACRLHDPAAPGQSVS